jgi:transposase
MEIWSGEVAMGLGRRKDERQEEFWVASDQLPKSPGHVFYEKLNGLLASAGFDAWVESLCEPYYSKSGRKSIPPGVYFRMLLVGYFEGIGSQRGIAWRCSDSLSLRKFLGIAQTEESPDHSSLSVIRERLPKEVHDAVFEWVLKLAQEKQVLDGRVLGVDSTTLEANAAMKSIVRKGTGEDWKKYVTGLMREQGVIAPDETPGFAELKQFDRLRKGKKASNDDWESPSDPDSRIVKMKDGTTHLAYKAEHAVDLKSELIVAAEIYYAIEGDARTVEDTVQIAQTHLQNSASDVRVQDVVLDKGYHSAETLETFAEKTAYRTYASVPNLPPGRRHIWTDKPATQKQAVYANNRRARGTRGRRLQRERSEKVERTFAHVCETGGARRTWLRGMEKVSKRYLISAVAHNLGCLMRALFGIGTPRGLQQYADLAEDLGVLCLTWLAKIVAGTHREPRSRSCFENRRSCPQNNRRRHAIVPRLPKGRFSTGC